VLGIAVTASSIVLMPALGIAKRRLGEQLGSGATAGEGTQNLLCAAQGGAVLAGLAANSLLGSWWLDPVIALGLAGVALREGRETWRGEGCACHSPVELGTEAHADRCCDDC
jgi:divalent metal cation (Fe/Co/Zn/Cd) transporter